MNRPLLALLLALLAALPAGAESPLPEPVRGRCPGRLLPRAVEGRLASLERIPVGTWVQYAITSAQGSGTRPALIRIAIVGREPASDGLPPATWLELTTATAALGQQIVKDLVTTSDAGAPTTVRRLLVQLGQAAPLEMPVNRPSSTPATPPCARHRHKPKSLGVESVTTPAGTFQARHARHRFADGSVLDLWGSTRVPLLGIVKLDGPTGRWTLQGKGTDAVSALTGEPVPFRPPEPPPPRPIDPAQGGTDPLELPP